MANLVSASAFKAITPVNLADSDLDAVIERVEAEITADIGAPYSAGLEITETLDGGQADLFLLRPVSAIVSVTEYDSWIDSDATTEALTAGDDYVLYANEGRLRRINERSTWHVKNVIVYTPRDDTKARQAAIIDLTRLALARSAYRSESVGGEVSYTAPPDWELERLRIMRRITFKRI